MSQRLIYLLASLSIGACLMLLPGCVTDRQPQQPDVKEVKPVKPTSLPQELAEYKPTIAASKKSYIRIDLQKAVGLAITASKFLGVPYVPKGQAYPNDKDGRPLVLLAQINFADVPKYPDFPQQGILQFYIQPRDGDGQTHIWGMNMSSEPDFFRSLHQPDYFRVIYHPTIGEAANPAEIPQYRGAGMPIDTEAALSFKLDTESVNADDYQFEQYFGVSVTDFFQKNKGIPEEKIVDFYDYLVNHAPAKIGGYGRFVQRDPRTYAPDKADWIVLLNIDSTSIPGGGEILWGDAGIGTFLIRKQDLAKRDFSNVAYYWDNH
jgi:uncharacterized protein YwqG